MLSSTGSSKVSRPFKPAMMDLEVKISACMVKVHVFYCPQALNPVTHDFGQYLPVMDGHFDALPVCGKHALQNGRCQHFLRTAC